MLKLEEDDRVGPDQRREPCQMKEDSAGKHRRKQDEVEAVPELRNESNRSNPHPGM